MITIIDFYLTFIDYLYAVTDFLMIFFLCRSEIWNLGFDNILMMRFRKGSTVEVLSKREVPSGSWFRAEIISGNGHYYNVKYEHCSPDGDQATEKVQRKAIRPCAPPIVGSRSWIHGDIVEVFEKSSWKPAKVIKVLNGGNYSIISLIGSFEELMLHKSNIRLQQFWKCNRWVMFDKESEILNEGDMEVLPEVGRFND